MDNIGNDVYTVFEYGIFDPLIDIGGLQLLSEVLADNDFNVDSIELWIKVREILTENKDKFQ